MAVGGDISPIPNAPTFFWEKCVWVLTFGQHNAIIITKTGGRRNADDAERDGKTLKSQRFRRDQAAGDIAYTDAKPKNGKTDDCPDAQQGIRQRVRKSDIETGGIDISSAYAK